MLLDGSATRKRPPAQVQQHIWFNQFPAAASSASRMGHHIKKASNALMHSGYACMHGVLILKASRGVMIGTQHQRGDA